MSGVILNNSSGCGFCDILNNQSQGNCYPKTDITKTLIIPDITKTELIIVLAYIVLKKVTHKTHHRTQHSLALLLEILYCVHNLQICQLSGSR